MQMMVSMRTEQHKFGPSRIDCNREVTAISMVTARTCSTVLGLLPQRGMYLQPVKIHFHGHIGEPGSFSLCPFSLVVFRPC